MSGVTYTARAAASPIAARHTPPMVYGAATLIGASRYLLRAPAPDDYDAIGFVAAVRDFDPARFQPQAPGYPVYVLLARLADSFVDDPLRATELVSAGAAAATAIAAFSLARGASARAAGASPLRDRRAGWIAMSLVGVAALPWVLGGSALSDACATALVAAAFASALASPPRLALAGILFGLTLGVRLSYAPLLPGLIVLVAARRGVAPAALARFAAGLGAALVAWCAPLAHLVGARRLLTLSVQHGAGHFARWGGTIVTHPDPGARAWTFLRGLLYDGVAPNETVLAALAALLLCAFFVGRARTDSASGLNRQFLARSSRRWRRCWSVAGRKPAPSSRLALVENPLRDPPASSSGKRCEAPPRSETSTTLRGVALTAPYALWVLLGQNVTASPRHLLPLVIAALVALGAFLSRHPPPLAVAVIALCGAASLPLVLQHARTLAPDQQLARYLAANERARPLAIFGGRSLRAVRSFAADDGAAAPGGLVVIERASLSEVDVALERLDVLPERLLVTSETAADPSRSNLREPIARFCRDARLERGGACLDLYRYRFGAALRTGAP